MALTAAQLNVIFSSKGADAVKGDLKDVESSITTVGAALTAMGGAGVAGLGLMTKSSMDFSAAMSNVQSIARVSDEELANLSDTILEMSTAFGAMPTDLAAGLYDIIGSGFEDTAESAMILEAAVVAAGAGLTDTATAVQAITAVLNAFGMEAESAGDVSDVLFKTVDSGVISFEQLAKNLGNTIPLASNLGVTIEELGAAYAEMTLQGIGASQAETQIAALMRSAIAPTEALTRAVQEYGYASAEALIQSEGLAGYLQFLQQASGGTSEGLRDLVGTAEAVNAALALSRNEGENFTAMLETMGGAAQDGAYTLEVFGLQMDNAAGSVRRAQAEIGVAAINMGQAFEPLVGIGAEVVAGLAGAFNDLPGPIQQTVAVMAGLGSVSSLALGSFMLLIPKVVEFRNAMRTLGGMRGILTGLAGAMNPVALGLGALAAAGIYTWSTFREGREAAQQLEDALVQLGDVATNLRLGHRDDEAGLVDSFRRDIESVSELAEDYIKIRTEAVKDLPGSGQMMVDIIEGYERTAEEAKEVANAQITLANAFADSRVDAAALDAHLRSLYNQYIAGQINLDQYDDALIDVAGNLDRFRATSEDAAAGVETLGASTNTASDAIARMDEQLANTDEVLARLDERFEALAERQREWIENALEVAGLDDPLSQWNLAGFASDAAALADNLNDAAAAAESVFRVIVGNTDAIKSQADAVLNWADSLIAVRGEYSRLDELVEKGLITGMSGVFDDGSQYAEAQNAYDSIAESVERIHDNLDAVQAIQAPLIAEMTEQAAAYTDELLAMEPAQQLVALGWMDSATSAKAMEIAMLGASAAAGDLGVNGMEAFASLVMGASQADPVLKALLIDMGVISEGADGTITINTDGLESAKADLDDINTTLGHLIDTLKGDDLGTYELKIKAELDTSDFTDGSGWVGEGIGRAITIPVSADTGPAALELNAFKEQEQTPVELPVVVTIADTIGGAVDWLGDKIGGVLGGGTPVDDTTATVTVNLQDNATAGLLDIGSTLGGLDAASALVVVNGNNANALQATLEAQLALFALDGQSALIEILGDNSNALAAIGEIEAYNGVVLATSYHDIVTRQIGATAAGFQTGAGFLAGFDRAMDIKSPSGEMEKRGIYMFQGLDQGWSRESHDLAVGVSSPGYSAYGVGSGAGAGSITINNTVTVNAETGADAHEIAVEVAEVITPALTSALTQRRAGFGGVTV